MVQRCRTPCRSHQTAMTGAPHFGQTFRVQREFTTISWAAKITIPRTGMRATRILADPELRRLVDFDEPAGLLLVSMLHFLSHADDPAALIGAPLEPFPPGR